MHLKANDYTFVTLQFGLGLFVVVHESTFRGRALMIIYYGRGNEFHLTVIDEMLLKFYPKKN